jgi:SNF2 family DNA or RNA helicase
MGYRSSHFQATDYMEYSWKPKDGAQNTIEHRISDITLTLHSRDWLDIPDTIVEDVEVSMPHGLMDEYRKFEKELVLQILRDQQEGKEIAAANAAVLVTKLLQFTSGAIYDEDRLTHVLHDAKMQALKGIIKRTHGPVLVACHFKHEQDRIRQLLPQAEFFAAAKTPKSQMELINRWNAGEIPVLVAHPKSVGHGLNLQHGSNTMVWVSLTYSRELYEQMICRLVRRGQDKAVTVYRLMCPGTVDDAVAEALAMKADVETRLLNALKMLESFRNK